MHHPKPKSAPARLKSKFVKNRTNAMKEIEAWVRKDNETFPVPETSRMSGQLTDNVTEERMLKAKLWELSKERYKFLSQNTYEKKVFQDRQQRKSGLRRISSASADGRQKSVSDEITAISDGRRTSMGLVSTTQPKTGPKNARFSLLDRLDITKKKSRGKKTEVVNETDVSVISKLNSSEGVRPKKLDVKPTLPPGEDPSSSARTAIVVAKQRREDVPTTSGARTPLTRATSVPIMDASKGLSQPTPEPKPSETNVRSSALSRPPWMRQKQDQDATNKAETKPHNISGANTPRSTDAMAASDAESTARPQTTKSESGRYGMPAETLTTDPRFTVLERSLCPLTRNKTSGDIPEIVANIESLHVRPRKRLPDAPKSKIEVKAYEFMKEKGFVF
ncbi:uncharacterized protein LOC101864130 isoform X2 [Aplysia californica]|uniref:Uncharacterized protein LOC101864130 isoform X2 n=1 Tax=Aplysia californica TaxID=6500 RepID=A0ABM0JI66_APLCA|nr:uncharacterized protein LOC101864130 isoform X2 [Aplysia californica]